MSRRLYSAAVSPEALRAQREYDRLRSQLLDFPGPYDRPSPLARVRRWWRKLRLRRRAKSFWCTVKNGGHELYVARSYDEIYQECLLCGHETSGWKIDRRDDRMGLSAPRRRRE